MPTAIELKAQRNTTWERMKAIYDRANTEKRRMDGEETANWETANADVDRLDREITIAEVMERTPMTEAEERGRGNVSALDRLLHAPAAEVRASSEFRETFKKWMVFGDRGLGMEERQLLGTSAVQITPEMRAMGVSTGAAGGLFVPPEFQRSIEQAMLYYGGMRQTAAVIKTDSGADLPYPTSDDTSNTGELLAETGTVSAQDVATGARILKAYMFSSKIVRVSYQLLQDSAFDIETWLSKILGERLGRITNTYFTTGVGANQPQGIVTAATLGQSGATGQTTIVTWDDLIKLEHSVDISYRSGPGTGYMLSDTGLRDVRLIKDGDGRFVWQPGYTQGVPNLIDGFRYTVNNDMPVQAASAKSILFGDLSKYLIRDVAGVQLIRLDELYATQLQVAFLAFLRCDGGLIDAGTHPVKYYQNSAT